MAVDKEDYDNINIHIATCLDEDLLPLRDIKPTMIRKGQVLGITRKNLHGQAWVLGALLGIN
jgi:hypothetical protein